MSWLSENPKHCIKSNPRFRLKLKNCYTGFRVNLKYCQTFNAHRLADVFGKVLNAI